MKNTGELEERARGVGGGERSEHWKREKVRSVVRSKGKRGH